MRKYLSVVMIMAALLVFCTACAKVNKDSTAKLNIVTTIYPLYDWTVNITKDKADVCCLLENGSDIHNYQPSASDLLKINSCDVFIYIGGESDEWVEDALNSTQNDKRKAICVMDLLKSRLIIEDPEEDEEEYDEHIWLSVQNAKIVVEEIAKILKEKTQNSDLMQNAKIYVNELEALDKDFQEFRDSLPDKPVVIFADRFPFRYFTEDYDIDSYAAFKGCSAETEASFETIAKLADALNNTNTDYLFVIEGSDHKIAETIRKTSEKPDAVILEVNSMQTGEKGDYLTVMKNNMDHFKEAFK